MAPISNNIISHAAFLQDSSPIDPSFKRILETSSLPKIHFRAINSASNYNLTNDTPNLSTHPTPLHKQTWRNDMSPATITVITILAVLVVFVIIFQIYRRYEEGVEARRQRREEEWSSLRREREEGEVASIDLGQFGRVEPVESKSAQEVQKERRWFGGGRFRLWLQEGWIIG
jgi:hypothetical protein